MERRGFIGSLLAFVAWVFTVRGETSMRQDAVMSLEKLKEQLTGCWQLRQPPLTRMWNPDTVQFSSVDCGAMTCPLENIEEGFQANLFTSKYRYHITAKPDYLGCILHRRSPDPGEDWCRMTDLADGKMTVQTWHRIVEDIMRVETTGSKYKNRSAKISV